MTSDLTRWIDDSSATPRISEISLYPFMQECLSKFPDVKAVSSVRIDGETDILAAIDETKVVFEVKATDSYVGLLDAVLQATRYTEKLGTQNFVVVAYPSRIRRLPARSHVIKKTALESPIRAIVVTRGFRGRIDQITFSELVNRILDAERTYKKKLKPVVAYNAIVEVARDSVGKISEYLRIYHGLEETLAEVAIGQFDLYQAVLSDVVDSKHLKKEARALFWDIVSYVLVNQLLFYNIVRKIPGKNLPELPEVHPLTVSDDLLYKVKDCFALIEEDYSPVFASNSIDVLIKTRDIRVNQALGRLIFVIKRLEPEHVDVDLLGRLYHDTIPPTTRKRMGAFYTNPHAAELLATISLTKWDSTVLDPACGSGTLLVSSYERKKSLLTSKTKRKLTTNMHTKFLEDHIYGVDAMLFASHIAATNLLLQMSGATVRKINVFSANSLDLMAKTKENKSDKMIPNDYFDLIIMNPPFTFWRRLPSDERRKLKENFGTSSMNYWGYFLLAAMPKLKKDGIIASVLPDDFLRGKGAIRVRESFFTTKNSYSLRAIVKSKVEVAFSESSKFRDYLVLIQKTQPKTGDKIATVLVNKPTSRLSPESIIELSKQLGSLSEKKIASDDFCIYTHPHVMVNKHIFNLHPLVAFTKPELRDIWLNMLDFLETSEVFTTLGDLEEAGKIRVRIYRPGQYRQYNLAPREVKSKVCEIARNLFATKYKAGGKWLFRVANEKEEKVRFSVRKLKSSFSIPRNELLPSLRTYSSVKTFDVSDSSEFIIQNPTEIPEEIRKLIGWDEEAASYAVKDIKEAYNDLSGNCVLLMKPQIPSPNLFWLCYYSNRPLLSTNDYILRMTGTDQDYPKILTLFINSIPGILQIFALRPEIRGAWSRLDKESVWKHLYVPNPELIGNMKRKKLIATFDEFSSMENGDLQHRLSDPDSFQTSIDQVILETFKFETLSKKLQKVHNFLGTELQNLLDVMTFTK